MTEDRLSDGTPIMWMACACYIWPVTSIGRCGRCGEAAMRLVDRPAGGKARPLTSQERLEQEL